MVGLVRTKNSTIKEHVHIRTQTVHLVLKDPVAHLGLLECEEPPLSQKDTQAAVVWVLAVDPRRCSKSCQSASAVLHGWERQDSRADFSVFFYTGEGSGCQHTSAQPHLKAVDSLFITEQPFFFFFLGRIYFVCACVCTIGKQAVITGLNSDRWSMVLQKCFINQKDVFTEAYILVT